MNEAWFYDYKFKAVLVSLQIMYNPEPNMRAIPIKAVKSGQCPKTKTPHMIANGKAIYSMGAINAASLAR